MTITNISVERLSLVSSRPFPDVVAAIESAVGHPDMSRFGESVAAAKSWAQLEAVVNAAIGPSGFMEFTRIEHGGFLEKAGLPSRIVRFILGNPLIMRQMVEHVPDAGSYAPVTVLVDQRGDGVHISYDKMAGYLAHYGNLAALEVAHALDAKVETLLRVAAG
jgi:uncharacterized protein (DUF302 family)